MQEDGITHSADLCGSQSLHAVEDDSARTPPWLTGFVLDSGTRLFGAARGPDMDILARYILEQVRVLIGRLESNATPLNAPFRACSNRSCVRVDFLERSGRFTTPNRHDAHESGNSENGPAVHVQTPGQPIARKRYIAIPLRFRLIRPIDFQSTQEAI